MRYNIHDSWHRLIRFLYDLTPDRHHPLVIVIDIDAFNVSQSIDPFISINDLHHGFFYLHCLTMFSQSIDLVHDFEISIHCQYLYPFEFYFIVSI